MADKADFYNPVRSTFAVSVMRRRLACHGRSAFSVKQRRLLLLHFLLHLVYLITVLLCRISFAWTQKTVMDDIGCRPSNRNHYFFGAVSASESAVVVDFILTNEQNIVGSTFQLVPQTAQKKTRSC